MLWALIQQNLAEIGVYVVYIHLSTHPHHLILTLIEKID